MKIWLTPHAIWKQIKFYIGFLNKLRTMNITHLSSILISFSLSSRNDTTLEGREDGSIILLLVLLDKVLESCSPPTSVVMVTNVPLVGCWNGAILIFCGISLLLSSKVSKFAMEASFSQTLQHIPLWLQSMQMSCMQKVNFVRRDHVEGVSHWDSDGHEGICSFLRLPFRARP